MGDIKAGRLDAAALAENFADAHPPLDDKNAVIEASRCYYCYDAPCIKACPTGIDIPSFIKKITTGNLKGSAADILSANIMGGMCARVCPTEILCEDKCVRNAEGHKPVEIGNLQRYATDKLFAAGTQLFERAAPTGKRVAVVGGGPAGLSCAHRLAVLGHDVTVFEAREKLGGLNEYGIAAYKTVDDYAAREVDYILSIGGITVKTGKALGRDFTLAALRAQYDAVFLGLGLGAVNALRCDGEDLTGVYNAVDVIADIRQAQDLSALPVGRRVVVIGGGNTAVDAAVQTRKLGAEDVTLVYRRGKDNMSATWVEQQFAQTNGVTVKHWLAPKRVIAEDGTVAGVEFAYTATGPDGRLTETGETTVIPCDTVLKAIGQMFVPASVSEDGAAVLEMDGGRIAVDETRRTSMDGVWAGGDCVAGGQDLTVQGVEDGKIAAHAIDAWLRAGLATGTAAATGTGPGAGATASQPA
ncbi:NAD(P)-dependent oxidoreductase [Caenispirillum salinarum]|uniref:NAD(P)-dependent oxidoreductase n=1 Tax=Caenispirillum salinarum TaxID=859058 RepID=UPI00384DC1E4